MEITKYIKHLRNLFDFMKKEEGIDAPYPKVVFHTKLQDGEESLLTRTGYFDPNTNKIHIFVCDNADYRTVKDVCRSFCHECIHLFQQYKGDIGKSGYSSDRISDDENLIGLEKEAYLKGNIYFRKYTESLKK